VPSLTSTSVGKVCTSQGTFTLQPLYHNEPEEVFLDSALSSSAGHAGDSGDFAQSMSAGEVDLHVLGLDDAATVSSLR